MQQPNERGGGAPRRVRDHRATCYVCRRPAHMYDGWVHLWGGRPHCSACVPGEGGVNSWGSIPRNRSASAFFVPAGFRVLAPAREDYVNAVAPRKEYLLWENEDQHLSHRSSNY